MGEDNRFTSGVESINVGESRTFLSENERIIAPNQGLFRLDEENSNQSSLPVVNPFNKQS